VPVTLVHAADDARIDDYRNVPDPELLARRGVFIAEGRLVVRRLLEGRRFRVRSVMVTEPALASIGDALDAHPSMPVYVVSQATMNGITGFNMHRGCLAVGERPPMPDVVSLATGARRVLVMEGVANADNVGGLFRNAAAFGADAVLLDASSTDPLYRKAIRTSVGTALQVPFARVDDLGAALDTLRRAGLRLIALTPAPDARDLRETAADLRGQRLALLVGHEGQGLTDDTVEACDVRIRIPIAAGVDSLNVAAAAGIALYALTS
jgi:tRNA G18 (ribose-2'-O)-methylase SpoU